MAPLKELAFAAALLACATPSDAQTHGIPVAAPKRVILIHSFGRQYEPFSSAASSFRTELALHSREPIEFYEMMLETARFTEGDIERPQAEYVRMLCETKAPDLVVPVGGPAFRFCVRHRDLFPGIPLLASAMEHRHLAGVDLGDNATAITYNLNMAGFIEDILHVLPATKTIGVVLGDSPLERFWVEELKREFRVFDDRVAFVWFDDLPFSQVRKRASSMPSNTVLLFGMMDVDVAGVPYEQQSALDSLHAVANVPIFGVFEEQMGRGVVGGRLTRAHALGAQGARIALRILAGESAGSIPVVTLPVPAPVYDWRELERWGISESLLPAGSEIRFRAPPFWKIYRWHIAAVSGFVAFESILIALLLANRGKLRSARNDLQEKAEHMSLAARAAQLASWTLDLKTNRVWTTPEGRAFLGWDDSDPVDFERFVATMPPEDRNRARRGITRALEGNGDFEAEYRIVRADGSERWISMRGRAEFDHEHRPVCLRGISRDVTAQHQAVAEAQQLRRELAHRGRVSLMGQLVASLSHELGQPLGAILRNADAAELFLKSDKPDLEEIRAIVGDIRRDDERAAAVIARTRSLLRHGAVDMQAQNFRQLVDEMRLMVGPDAETRHIKIEREIPPDLPMLLGDRVHLQQVLINLVMNAMDAIDALPRGERRVVIGAHVASSDGWIEASVRDTGTGVPGDRMESIFNPFFTSKPEGMGMGLTISKTIIEAHGGRIWAENQHGGGAIFRFTLPTAEESSA